MTPLHVRSGFDLGAAGLLRLTLAMAAAGCLVATRPL
jgi:hypothetical protein